VFGDSKAFSGFAVSDLAEAEKFYGETLGLRTERLSEHLLTLHHPEDRATLVYAKPDHEPANFTLLNFQVDDIDTAVDGLTQRGVELERYEGFDHDDRGIFRGEGPPIAWFKDPAGNVLSAIQVS
jgi:catechol 2,3-dioxygenase-like lactoylglutathione lyase family enzyme